MSPRMSPKPLPALVLLRRKFAARLSYANIVATLALFLALGGGAWALSQNSVGTRQIKPGAVRSSDVKNKALRGIDVAPDSLTGASIKESSLGAVTGLTSISCGPGPGPHGYCVGTTESNSDSPKSVFTTCGDKQILTYHASVFGGVTGAPPNAVSHVAVTGVKVEHVLTGDWVTAEAYEVAPTDEDWSLFLRVWCIDDEGSAGGAFPRG